jgi:hypothetical protein
VGLRHSTDRFIRWIAPCWMTTHSTMWMLSLPIAPSYRVASISTNVLIADYGTDYAISMC